jgi:copper(I)-binding protein
LALLASGLTILCVLVACAAPAGPAAGSTGALMVQDVVARPGPAGGISGAFLTVVNSGDTADRLVSARTTIAPTTELHETIDDNGVMKMRPAANGFEVPAKGKLELKPGGKHMMFVDLTSAVAVGSEIEITLVFEKAGAVTVKAPVKQ